MSIHSFGAATTKDTVTDTHRNYSDTIKQKKIENFQLEE